MRALLQEKTTYLVVDNCFRIIKHKLPVITVHEAQQCHQGDSDLGLDRCELWEGYLAIPIHFRQCHDAPGRRSFSIIISEGVSAERHRHIIQLIQPCVIKKNANMHNKETLYFYNGLIHTLSFERHIVRGHSVFFNSHVSFFTSWLTSKC